MIKVVVAQKGAREHFLAARALHKREMLAGLVVDWYAPKSPLFQRLGSLAGGTRGKAALAARCEAIPDDLVRAFPIRSLFWKYHERRLAAQGRAFEAYVLTDAAFAEAVARLRLPDHRVFFGYSYASLEALEAEKSRGVFTVLDQIDPGPVEFRMVAEEMARFPGLAGPPPAFPTGHFDRARREWELADMIVVNSEWSRQAIIAEGADAGKIEILPLAYARGHETIADSGPASPLRAPSSSKRALRVLWLGQVNLRKGIHYLLEAARLLEREPVEFLVAGPLGIWKAAIAEAPKSVSWLGPIPRSQTSELYRQSDVFVLPTLSDGFALTQLEALAHGLPVIATPNCGRVVDDGQTGLLIPARDSKALADAVMRFVQNRPLVSEMSPRCVEASTAFSIDAYGRKLLELIEGRIKTTVSVRDE